MRRRLSLILIGVSFVLLLAIATSFALAYRARSEAAKYLQIVAPLRIGTEYGAVVGELRRARLPFVLLDGCHPRCVLLLDVDDQWLYKLHLAAPAGFAGRLDFQNGKLTHKFTVMGVMGHGVCCFATVEESASATSGVFPGNLDSSGHPWRLRVELAASDFGECRRQAYAFNVACIGAMRACRTDEYLTTVNCPEPAAWQ